MYILGLYWDNGKENGNYRDYRGFIGEHQPLQCPKHVCTMGARVYMYTYLYVYIHKNIYTLNPKP